MRKAIAQAHCQSLGIAGIKILEQSGHSDLLTSVAEQEEGEYRKDCKELIFNWISPQIEVKVSENKGRGVFTTKPFKKGDLMIVEQALAEGLVSNENESFVFKNSSKFIADRGHTDLVKKCFHLA